MKQISETVIDEIVKRTDLVDLASRAGLRLKERGRGDFWGCCPFHREATPSFHIVQRRGFYKCFGCGASGGAIRFWRETQSLGFVDAVTELAGLAGIMLDDADDAPAQARKPVVVDQSAPDDSDRLADSHAKRARAKKNWWQKTVPIAGTVAETYLVEARAIRSRIFRDIPALRFMPDAPYWSAVGGGYQVIHRGPALVAGMQYPDGQFAAVHVTYLEADGLDKLTLWKRPPTAWDSGEQFVAKKVQGAPGGAAIRLGPPDPRMAVAEGIETALSCMNEGGPVTWSAYSLNNMAGATIEGGTGDPHPDDGRKRLPCVIPDLTRPGFTFPSICDWALVIGDGDTKDIRVNTALLTRAVHKFRMQGIDAGYRITPPGTDLNDLLVGERAMARRAMPSPICEADNTGK